MYYRRAHRPARRGGGPMRAALCVDNRMGFQFNGRRLSRDRVQQEDLLALCR